MTTLVTGAGGYVGRNLIDALLERRQPVRALVRNDDQAAPLRQRGVEVSVGDIRDREFVREAVRGANVVQHCAAAVGPHYSDREIHDICLEGSRNVLEGVRDQGSGRVVIISSINVLGNRNLSGESEDLPCRRFGEIRSDVKIDIEHLAKSFQRDAGVDVVILRPAMIYGRGDQNLEKLLRPIRKGKFAFLGRRDNVIPLVHIDDVVQAMLLAAETPAAGGRIYHIADGAEITAGQLANELARLTDSPPPQKILPYFIPWFAATLFETLRTLKLFKGKPPINRVSLRFLGTSRSIDIGRARRELGYQPHVDFQNGMAAAVSGLTSHADAEPDVASTSA
ncbi:MAG: NAD-dependent epimerase/dehydratase family protein [Planctomycetota bacterium]|nr:NAD-dependent epimerase/dehydratase family protein [Planctomycetota bacterium]MDA1214013.1 NAD-dependent epimerase/dehydratase family protein [Planctomycetota bacterium]